ncbi:hypothetical protein DDZ18_01820 [Marinicauda salina]|uniref:Tim44-like domain-containing protein n=1 Tax=Marinicauda salina TaxID=2135793 RepID=A0A2U2BWJ1_9PROT|nr:Tim44/TimA family putative adaptor protein [Marinicauda salina]PWE18367.1 hypothetical protein DDZ18_01820 [Marinicauda salina]
MELLQILFFAGLAVFLAVRLYLTLGRPTGRSPEEHARERRAAQGQARPAPGAPAPTADLGGETARAPVFSGPAADGLSAIAAADPGFDPEGFVEGARKAYQMIVENYAKGDRDALRPLLSERVFARWSEAMDKRDAAGETQTTEVERIKAAEIVEASLNESRARVKIRFTAELATETRDTDGAVVAGDLNTLDTVDEIWSFERDVADPDPNWLLAAVKPV